MRRHRIADLQDLLFRRERILRVVESEADELVAKYGTPRRTAIITDGAPKWLTCMVGGWAPWVGNTVAQRLSMLPCPAGEVELRREDVTPNASSLVVYSRRGYIKRMRADTFGVQGLGGKGRCPSGGRAPAQPALLLG